MTSPFITPAAGPYSFGYDLHADGRKVARFAKIEDATRFNASDDLIKALQLMLGATDPRLEAVDKPAYVEAMREIAHKALAKAGVTEEPRRSA